MSGTGSTQFPQGPRFDKNADVKAVKTVFNGSLIGVPNANKGSENRIQHLKGQVIQQNDKGQVRIQTEKGVVEIQLPKDSPRREQPLKRGQTVNIEIPPQNVRNRNPDSVKIQTETPPRPVKTQLSQEAAQQITQTDGLANATPKDTGNAQRTPEQTAQKNDSAVAISTQSDALTLKKITNDLQSLANTPLKTSIPIEKLVGETIRLDPLPPSLISQLTTIQIEKLPQILTQQAIQSTSQTISSGAESFQIEELLTLKTAEITKTPITNFVTQDNKANNSPLNIAFAQNTPPPVVFNFIAPQQTDTKAPIPDQNTLVPFKNIAVQLIQLRNIPEELTIQKISLDQPEILKPAESLKQLPIVATIQSVSPFVPLITPPDDDIPASFKILEPARIVEITPERIILETSPANNTQQAVIIGKTENNLPVIIFPLSEPARQNHFILQVPVQDIITGQTLEISAHAPNTATLVTTGVAQTPLPLPGYFLIPGQWPLMEDILQSIQQGSFATAQSFSASIPNASRPAQIPPAALFFIAALRAGDISGILGERAQNILKTQGKSGLLSRLTQEGNMINRTEQNQAEWRSLTLPLAWENEIQKIALHYKHDYPDDSEEKKGEKQTRFIFDLSLTRMGKVQLDGLHKDKRLNVIIRAENSFSQAMQATMKQAYHSTLEDTDLSGDLSFQNNLDSWVKIAAPRTNEYQDSV